MAELVHEIMIDATPETIYGMITDREKHLQWEGTDATIDPRPGGTYEVLIAGQFPSGGEFVELVPHDKVVFTFGWDMPDNPITPGSTTVEITLHPEGGKTRLRLRHTGLPDDDAVHAHRHGWSYYTERLAAVAAGGQVGPDEGPPAP
jgi:uncharacterized protein YndB with AHSA1/START domain